MIGIFFYRLNDGHLIVLIRLQFDGTELWVDIEIKYLMDKPE